VAVAVALVPQAQQKMARMAVRHLSRDRQSLTLVAVVAQIFPAPQARAAQEAVALEIPAEIQMREPQAQPILVVAGAVVGTARQAAPVS